MKTGIIGLPQVGKTSLFRILTKAHLSATANNPREAHIGVAKVPDDRLDRLAALYNPKKLTHTSVEYVDVGAIGQDALKETAYIGHLRQVDALAHVVRVFEDPAVPLVAEIDPLRDIKNVEFDLMVSDLGQIEKRLERLEKDLKKMKTPELEKEFELLKRANTHLGSEKPLREMQMTPEDKKRLRGFMFLSEKPIFYVLNIDLVPTAKVNGAIKCQQISGGDGYATMGDGTQTYMFSFGPLSGLSNIALGLPGTDFPARLTTYTLGHSCRAIRRRPRTPAAHSRGTAPWA